MQWYEYHKKLYESCSSNKEYIQILQEYKDRVIEKNISLLKDQKNNSDILIKDNFDQIKLLFDTNKLVTSRLGNVESRFLIKNLFDMDVPGDYENLKSKDDDLRMKKNAGLYYQKEEDKKNIHDWWVNNAKELLLNNDTLLTSCFVHLPYDLILLSLLDIKNHYLMNFSSMINIIQWFEDKKVLLISNGVDSMIKSYSIGLQRIYTFKIPSFKLYTVKTPQTTTGMPYPDESSIQTTQRIITNIQNTCPDFDIALLSCGSYGPPLTIELKKTFGNKNMVYLGSMLYTMFGLYTHNLLKPSSKDGRFISDNFIVVEEKCPDACRNIDKGKYWNI